MNSDFIEGDDGLVHGLTDANSPLWETACGQSYRPCSESDLEDAPKREGRTWWASGDSINAGAFTQLTLDPEDVTCETCLKSIAIGLPGEVQRKPKTRVGAKATFILAGARLLLLTLAGFIMAIVFKLLLRQG